MRFDWSEYESDSDTEEVSLLLSVKSQSLILAAMQTLQFRSNWLEIDDATYDDVEAAVSEALEEIMRTVMPDFTPVGAIVAYAGTIAEIPPKWMICDGSLIPVAVFPELALAVQGSAFESGTDIALPDLRQRFIYGTDLTGELGDTGGETEHALTIAEMPAHTHTFGTSSGQGGRTDRVQRGDLTSLNTQTTNSAGSGDAHNNMPPYMMLIYIIKVTP